MVMVGLRMRFTSSMLWFSVADLGLEQDPSQKLRVKIIIIIIIINTLVIA
jgi:hypothetical protein